MNNSNLIDNHGFLKKGSAMYTSFLLSWVLCLFWFNPKLFSLFLGVTSLYAKVILVSFIICLDIFWLFGMYYIVMFVFTFFSQNVPSIAFKSNGGYPRVVILYLTMNDFKYEAALSCINQDYPNFEMFILDDSTEKTKRAEVDNFHKKFVHKVKLIRRTNRKGFKAGSLNNALNNFVKDFTYFAVIDADGVIPSDFIVKLIPYFELDEKIAFVQGSHRPNPKQKTLFARDLALGITPLWTVYYPPKNNYGFVMFLGHGGLIRRDIWELAGGFPEIASEDLGFSTKVRELGYKGLFIPSVSSYEDFPESYRQLRKQQERYVKGGCEYLKNYFPSFLRTKNIPWFEKLDVLMSCLTLFLPTFFLFFSLVYLFGIPTYFSHIKTLHISLGNFNINLGHVNFLKENFNSICTWDFYLITLLCTFAPFLGSLRLIYSKPIQTARLIVFSTVPYLSLMLVSTTGIFSYLVSKKAEFLVTGDNTEMVPNRDISFKKGFGALLTRVDSRSP